MKSLLLESGCARQRCNKSRSGSESEINLNALPLPDSPWPQPVWPSPGPRQRHQSWATLPVWTFCCWSPRSSGNTQQIESRGVAVFCLYWIGRLSIYIREPSTSKKQTHTPSWKWPHHIHCAWNHVEYADNHLATHESWQNTLIEDRSSSPGLDVRDSLQIRFLHPEVDVDSHRNRNLLPETWRPTQLIFVMLNLIAVRPQDLDLKYSPIVLPFGSTRRNIPLRT